MSTEDPIQDQKVEIKDVELDPDGYRSSFSSKERAKEVFGQFSGEWFTIPGMTNTPEYLAEHKDHFNSMNGTIVVCDGEEQMASSNSNPAKERELIRLGFTRDPDMFCPDMDVWYKGIRESN